jgi:hypothetical protein
MTNEQQQLVLSRAVTYLSEWFDTVQIIVTIDGNKPGVTSMVDKGAGNAYARAGSVRDWLLREDAQTKELAVRELDDDSEDL